MAITDTINATGSSEECYWEGDLMLLIKRLQKLSAKTRLDEVIVCALDVVAELIMPTEMYLYLGATKLLLMATYAIREGSKLVEHEKRSDFQDKSILDAMYEQKSVIAHQIAYVPIIENGHASGCLVIENSSKTAIPLGDLHCAQIVTEQLSIALTNANLIKASEDHIANRHQVIDQIPLHIFEGNADLTYVRFNQMAREYSNMSQEQFSNFGWLSIIHPDDVELMRRAWKYAFEEGNEFEYEARLRTKDGSYRRFIHRAVAIYDNQGVLINWFGFSIDVESLPDSPSQKHLYSMLQNTEERFKQLFESNIVSIFFTDADSYINDANEAFLNLVGYTRDEMLVEQRTKWTDLTISEHTHLDVQAVKEISSKGFCHALEKQIRLPSSGKEVWVIFGAALIECSYPFPKYKSMTTMVGFMMDISTRKEMENELFLATRAKSQFLANMSHELRTPFSGVLGMINLLADTKLNQTQRDYLETCMQSCTNLLEIIDNILDFSKLESGKVKLDCILFDPHEVIANISELLIVLAANNGLDLGWLVDHNVPRYLMGDPKRIRQNLLNLVGNALKFTHKGEVYTRCTLLAETDTEAVLKFEIVDTGIGLTPEQQVGLFVPFKQVDNSTTRIYGGTGLGLSICKQITELMGGEIGIVSEKDKGSNFWFTARLKKYQGPRHEKTPSLSLPHDLKILILSNSEMKAEHLKRALAPYSCHTIREPTQLLSHLAEAHSHQRPYHLVAITYDNRKKILSALSQINAQEAIASSVCILILSPPVTEPEARKDEITFYRECNSEFSRLRISRATQPPHRDRLIRSINGLLNNPVSPLKNYLHSYREKNLGKSKSDIEMDLLEEETQEMTPIADVATELAKIQRRFSDPRPLANLDVLIGEDNLIARKVVIKQLERYGCRSVIVAEDGEAVIQKFKSEHEKISIVLMDLHMPLVDGLEATRRIRLWEKESGSLKKIPILALTADVQESTKDECIRAGMDGALNKPINQKELLSVLLLWTTHRQPWGI